MKIYTWKDLQDKGESPAQVIAGGLVLVFVFVVVLGWAIFLSN